MNYCIKPTALILRIAFILIFPAAIFTGIVRAQETRIVIQLTPGTGHISVAGSSVPQTAWSFRDSYAGVSGLGGRIENFAVFDGQGTSIAVRKLAPGQFESISAGSKFKYEVNLAAPARASDAALVSWLNSEHGILMLGDFLPVTRETANDATAGKSNSVVVRVDTPPGWSTYFAEDKFGENEIKIDDIDRAAIAVGRNLRLSSRTVSGMRFMLVTDRDWAFSDSAAIDTAAKVLNAHSAIAGPLPCNQTALFMLPFPNNAPADKWSAQTRRCSVTLLMGQLPSRVAALSQLGNGLTHELFHLWIPNGMALKGDYDWFYEGFTVYQAARTAVRLDLLTFTDFLDALAHAYDGFVRAPDLNRWSLLEASKRRFSGGASAVYSKAMLVAFLYDLHLRYQSHGRRSLDDVYRTFVRKHQLRRDFRSADVSEDGNAAALEALRSELDERDFVQRLITDPVEIDLQSEIAAFGLRVEKVGFRNHIVVSDKLAKRQRDLLRDLGYNAHKR